MLLGNPTEFVVVLAFTPIGFCSEHAKGVKECSKAILLNVIGGCTAIIKMLEETSNI